MGYPQTNSLISASPRGDGRLAMFVSRLCVHHGATAPQIVGNNRLRSVMAPQSNDGRGIPDLPAPSRALRRVRIQGVSKSVEVARL